jgi:hypothetical protein
LPFPDRIDCLRLSVSWIGAEVRVRFLYRGWRHRGSSRVFAIRCGIEIPEDKDFDPVTSEPIARDGRLCYCAASDRYAGKSDQSRAKAGCPGHFLSCSLREMIQQFVQHSQPLFDGLHIAIETQLVLAVQPIDRRLALNKTNQSCRFDRGVILETEMTGRQTRFYLSNPEI